MYWVQFSHGTKLLLSVPSLLFSHTSLKITPWLFVFSCHGANLLWVYAWSFASSFTCLWPCLHCCKRTNLILCWNWWHHSRQTLLVALVCQKATKNMEWGEGHGWTALINIDDPEGSVCCTLSSAASLSPFKEPLEELWLNQRLWLYPGPSEPLKNAGHSLKP